MIIIKQMNRQPIGQNINDRGGGGALQIFKKCILLLTLSLSFAQISSGALLEINNLDLSADPMTVGAPSTLRFDATLQGSYFQTGQALLLTVEHPGNFNQTPTNASLLYMQSKCISAVAGIFITNCTLRTYTALMNMTVNSIQLSTAQIYIRDFWNPNSTQPIAFSLQLIDQNQIVIASTLSSTILKGWVPAQLLSTSLQTSSLIAGAITDLVVRFTPQNQLFPKGTVVVKFPLWNHLLDDSYRHYVIQEGLVCNNVLNMNTAMSCSYNKATQELTVSNPVTSMTLWKPLAFRISKIKNPYSVRPRGDFWIKTVNESGYTIDASQNLTLQITTTSNIKSATFVRKDTMTTVSEPSLVNLNFSVEFPIAFPCRVILQYPEDMRQFFPLNYVFSVVSKGFIENLVASDPFVQLFEQDGLTVAYMTSGMCGFNSLNQPQMDLMFFNSWDMPISNKAWVKDSGVFQIAVQEVYDGDFYQVAVKTTGLSFPKESFTPGTVESASVTTIAATGSLVKFKFTIKPAHYIPSNSRLIIKLPPSVCLSPGVCTISSVLGSMKTTVDLCYVDGSTLTINTPFGKTGFFQIGQADLSFVLNSLGTDPGAEVLSSQFIGVETYAVESGLGYIIDKKEPQSLPIEKLLASTYIQSTPTCVANSAKFCGSNGKFNPLFKFHQFEGSISLLSNGILISQDEVRTQFLNPTPNTCAGSKTQNAILSIMQVGNNRNDHDQNTFVDQMFPYINSISPTQIDPFVGGLFSFERCTYVFNMGYDQTANQRLYNIKRHKISIEHDDNLKVKQTVINIDKEWTRSQIASIPGHEDFPCGTLSDGLIYHPGIKGIIYFMDNRRTLTVKADLNIAANDDLCVADLFGLGHRMGQYQFDLAEEFRKINFLVYSFPANPFVFLNNNLYVVAYGRNIDKYPNDSNLKQSMIAKISLIASTETSYSVSAKNVTELWGYIDSINALEMQGFMFTVSNDTTGYRVLGLTPELYDSVKSGPSLVETDSKWKLIQARQDNHMHRPIFGVKETEKNVMYRITTIASKVLEDTTFNTNFYEFGVQLNRFFGLTVLPGSCYCGSVDRFNSIKGILLDLRYMRIDRCIDLPMFGCGDSRMSARNDEQCDDGNLINGDGCSKDCQIEQWWGCTQIEGERSICTPQLCGNGMVDVGEECDDGNSNNGDGCTTQCIEEKGWDCVSGNVPHCKWMCGDNKVYQQKKTRTDGTEYVFYEEKCDTNAGGCLSTCEPDIGWKCTTNYNTMISTCVPTCGNNAHDADMNEICDDGNNVSGDGCAKGCTVIEAPYVCPLVGKCNMYCGNGFFEGDDATLGLVGTQNEKCDDANRNSGDGCSNICEIEPGWTCVNKFIGLQLEKPGFRSFCTRSGSGLGEIDAAANKAFYQMAQVEEFTWDQYTARGSSTGKFRLIEYSGTRAGTKVELYGVTFVTRSNSIFQGREFTVVKQWQGGAYTNYVDTSRVLNTEAGISIQKGTFGKFLVRTDNPKQLGFYSFLESSGSADVTFGKFYDTYEIAPAEFMGDHEVYYWPRFKVILARLGDGYTFKLYRFTPNVIAVSQDKTQFTSEEWIESAFKLGFDMPGELKLEPVFFENYMAIYCKRISDSIPSLRIYKFLEQIENFDPVYEGFTPGAQSSQYLGYSLVYFGPEFGLLLKEHNNPTINRVTLPLQSSYPIIEANSFIPTTEQGKLVFIQRRHDPLSEEEEPRDVYGYFDNTAVYKFEGDAQLNKLRIILKIDLPTIGVFITENRMIDVGKYFLAVYSAANCDAIINKSLITKASVWFYHFSSGAWSCMDIPVISFAQWQQFAWWSNPTPTV